MSTYSTIQGNEPVAIAEPATNIDESTPEVTLLTQATAVPADIPNTQLKDVTINGKYDPPKNLLTLDTIVIGSDTFNFGEKGITTQNLEAMQIVPRLNEIVIKNGVNNALTDSRYQVYDTPLYNIAFNAIPGLEDKDARNEFFEWLDVNKERMKPENVHFPFVTKDKTVLENGIVNVEKTKEALNKSIRDTSLGGPNKQDFKNFFYDTSFDDTSNINNDEIKNAASDFARIAYDFYLFYKSIQTRVGIIDVKTAEEMNKVEREKSRQTGKSPIIIDYNNNFKNAYTFFAAFFYKKNKGLLTTELEKDPLQTLSQGKYTFQSGYNIFENKSLNTQGFFNRFLGTSGGRNNTRRKMKRSKTVRNKYRVRKSKKNIY